MRPDNLPEDRQGPTSPKREGEPSSTLWYVGFEAEIIKKINRDFDRMINKLYYESIIPPTT